MSIQLIAGEYRFSPTLRCHICGSTKGLHRNNKHLHGNDEIACMDCLFVWYDEGLTDLDKIRSASLKRQGRADSTIVASGDTQGSRVPP